MEAPIGFLMEGDRGVYRPVGSATFDEAAAGVRAAIAWARTNEVRDLLVDTTVLAGFNSPDLIPRFSAVAAWAEEARGRVRVAMVARAELIDPRKFGVTVAGNRGLQCNIFTSEAEARAWLDD